MNSYIKSSHVNNEFHSLSKNMAHYEKIYFALSSLSPFSLSPHVYTFAIIKLQGRKLWNVDTLHRCFLRFSIHFLLERVDRHASRSVRRIRCSKWKEFSIITEFMAERKDPVYRELLALERLRLRSRFSSSLPPFCRSFCSRPLFTSATFLYASASI